MEQWKPVLGYEGLYEISNHGNVRRVSRGKLFTANQVREAKQMFAQGATLKAVAEFLSTSITTAHSIKHGKTWKGDAEFRPVKTKIGTDQYVYFTPSKNGVYRHRPIHRCIWEAFVGAIEGRLEINHKNLDRQDNRLDNLELVTHQQNCEHAHVIYNKERKHLAKGERRGPRSKYAKVKHT
jgi:hypothetical protein